MAATNEVVALAEDTWTLISDSGADISAATVQNNGDTEVTVMATASETAPTAGILAGIVLAPGEGISSEKTIAQLFPGVTAGYRLYALSRGGAGSVFVSHA